MKERNPKIVKILANMATIKYILEEYDIPLVKISQIYDSIADIEHELMILIEEKSKKVD